MYVHIRGQTATVSRWLTGVMVIDSYNEMITEHPQWPHTAYRSTYTHIMLPFDQRTTIWAIHTCAHPSLTCAHIILCLHPVAETKLQTRDEIQARSRQKKHCQGDSGLSAKTFAETYIYVMVQWHQQSSQRARTICNEVPRYCQHYKMNKHRCRVCGWWHH